MNRGLPAGWTWPRALILLYLVALAVSHVVRLAAPGAVPAPGPGERELVVQAVRGDQRLAGQPVRLRVRVQGPDEQGGAAAPPVLLLHGSPGRSLDLQGVAGRLARERPVLVPDLPGFGRSQRSIPDYSLRAHADYMLQLLDRLEVQTADLVAFSMGGGVALELYHRAPERVRSLTLLAATGVQELELLGNHTVNHGLHGLQLWILRGLRDLVPHFGALDNAFIGVEYARNFYDSDQRPLRAILQRFEPPMLILHGAGDPLVPEAAAREHHRLVPQSEIFIDPDRSHFMPFTIPEQVAGRIGTFLQQVDQGTAPRRREASAERLRLATEPFDPGVIPEAEGFTLVLLVTLIILGTLVSEDLTCVVAGLLVAQGRMSFVVAAGACFAGIFFGDLLLYFAGRLVGRPLLRLPPFRWILDEERVDRTAHWFERKGPVVIALSRFLPGLRLPTYVAAGMLGTRFFVFAFWFFVAAGIWTPVFVGVSAVAGPAALTFLTSMGLGVGLALVAAAVLLLLTLRIAAESLTHRGRRRLYGAWHRWTRWEFWPPWLFYPPVVIHVLWLGLRFRGLTVFTAANPALPAGGFVGESKGDILESLRAAGAPVAPFRRLPAGESGAKRLEALRRFMADQQVSLPVVVKPDVGQRGEGVEIVRTEERLIRRLIDDPAALLVQRFVPGRELGVFFHRHPDEAEGRIFSITDKRMPTVTGDGERSLEQLIRDDERGAILVQAYLHEQAGRLQEVPSPGEEVRLVEVGTHCRGAIFLDGGWAITPELERAVNEMGRGFDGFFFGRYDLIAPDDQAFLQGRDLSIVELNGVTSEATSIYDPKNGLLDAYRILFRQWRRAFEIGAANRARGIRPAGTRVILALIRKRFAPRASRRREVAPPSS